MESLLLFLAAFSITMIIGLPIGYVLVNKKVKKNVEEAELKLTNDEKK